MSKFTGKILNFPNLTGKILNFRNLAGKVFNFPVLPDTFQDIYRYSKISEKLYKSWGELLRLARILSTKKLDLNQHQPFNRLKWIKSRGLKNPWM